MKYTITQSDLQSVLEYNQDTGNLIWLVDSAKNVKNGAVAGYLEKKGYLRIRIDNKAYYAHRLVWLYMYGVFPNGQIDHINGIKNDNRVENLRTADSSKNQFNSIGKPNRTGRKGVSKYSNRYLAKACIRGERIILGRFNTLDEASEAYQYFAKENHGEFYKKQSYG